MSILRGFCLIQEDYGRIMSMGRLIVEEGGVRENGSDNFITEICVLGK